MFARRGLGWSADQGSTNERNDGLEAFDKRPECIKTLKVEKVVNGIVNAGDTINVTLLVYNHKDTPVNTAILSDELPSGLTMIPTSVIGSNKTTLNSGLVSFELGKLDAGSSKVIRYSAVSNRNKPSIRQVIDDVEGTSLLAQISLEGPDTFRISTTNPHKGTKAWMIPGGRISVDQALYLKNPHLGKWSSARLAFFP
ncbi:MAG: DUF11 domain-containing protein [Haliscomenobacter sp.]|nr:hypothetical protein [Haliscomenobacter sp.]MBK9488904.1 DUF11 domain-containing protein [Haliscomenobacter sp.]